MTLARFAFVFCLAGLLIGLMITTVLLIQYAPGSSVRDIFGSLHLAAKLGAGVLLGLALAALTLAVLHRARRRRDNKLALILRIVAGASVALGLALAFVSWSSLSTSAPSVGDTGFALAAPTWAEIALMLALGFLPAVIALLGAAPVRVARRGL